MKRPTPVAKKPASPPPFKGIIGEPTTVLLAAVKPNGWNFNVLTPFEFTSLKHGLKEDGWLASDAMLVWGADEKGKARDLIINGENRWKAAQELGMTTGPAVVLDGLTRAQAVALTLKLRNRRGSAFDDDLLSRALREVQSGLETGLDLGLEVGLPEDALSRILSASPSPLPGSGDAPGPPPVLGDNGFEYAQKYGVIVMAADEAAQKEAFEKLTGLGYECKVVCV